MSLPILQTPVLNTTLPLSGLEVDYRPFTVREESILNLIAAGSEREEFDSEVVASIGKLIEACCLTEVDAKKMAILDCEYLFLKIKEASSGAILSKTYICKNKSEKTEEVCNHSTLVEEKCDKLELVGIDDVKNPVLQITPEMQIVMKIPTLGALQDSIKAIANNDSVELNIHLICNNVDKVIVGEDSFSNFSVEELKENIINNLTKGQLEMITDFLESLPTLKLKTGFTCQRCKFEHKIEVENLVNFFD